MMENTTPLHKAAHMKNPSKKLPRGTEETHRYLMLFPKTLWKRMIDFGLTWGSVRKFLIEAVTEKLDREEKKRDN